MELYEEIISNHNLQVPGTRRGGLSYGSYNMCRSKMYDNDSTKCGREINGLNPCRVIAFFGK